jgi:hypothetical protein
MTLSRLGIADGDAEVPSHICLMYLGDEELTRALVAFVAPALEETGEGVVLFGAPGVASMFLERLASSAAGREVTAALDAGRIRLAESARDVGQQVENILAPVEALAQRGLRPIRVFGRVEWDVPGFALPEDFLWCESVLNRVIAKVPAILVCVYDVTRLPATALLLGGLETHPFVVVNGTLSTNPHFVPPERFLSERLLQLPWLHR